MIIFIKIKANQNYRMSLHKLKRNKFKITVPKILLIKILKLNKKKLIN
jgi:hypothetical protein